MNACGIDRCHGRLERLPRWVEETPVGNEMILENQGCEAEGAGARHHGFIPSQRRPVNQRHQKRRDIAGLRADWVFNSCKQVGALDDGTVGDPRLRAADQPSAVHAPCLCLQRGQIAAAVGLGHGWGAQRSPAQHGGQELGTLLLGAEARHASHGALQVVDGKGGGKTMLRHRLRHANLAEERGVVAAEFPWRLKPQEAFLCPPVDP